MWRKENRKKTKVNGRKRKRREGLCKKRFFRLFFRFAAEGREAATARSAERRHKPNPSPTTEKVRRGRQKTTKKSSSGHRVLKWVKKARCKNLKIQNVLKFQK